MMFPASKPNQISEKEIDIVDGGDSSRRGSPGLVKRRVLEMSTHHQGSKSSPSSSSSPHKPRKSSSSPKTTSKRGIYSSSDHSKLLYAPKPFKKENLNKPVTKSPSLKQGPLVTTSQNVPQNGPHGSKPAVPPKPRHVVVKRENSAKFKKAHKNKEDNNDSGLSEEAEDSFNESPIKHCSFTSLSQKIDDQRFDLLKRRQSYSEFKDLIEKKRELRERMLSKIMFLRDERDLLTEEKNENDEVGKTIAEKLEMSASGTELDKFRQFLEEIEQITKLTVSLTIRLSRLTKRIETGSFSKEEMTMQKKKQSRLMDQLQEAEHLHRNTDRRSFQVRQLLSKHLMDEKEVEKYDEFLVNLIKHITDLKETEQRIQLGEEQLVALNDNLIAIP